MNGLCGRDLRQTWFLNGLSGCNLWQEKFMDLISGCDSIHKPFMDGLLDCDMVLRRFSMIYDSCCILCRCCSGRRHLKRIYSERYRLGRSCSRPFWRGVCGPHTEQQWLSLEVVLTVAWSLGHPEPAELGPLDLELPGSSWLMNSTLDQAPYPLAWQPWRDLTLPWWPFHEEALWLDSNMTVLT